MGVRRAGVKAGLHAGDPTRLIAIEEHNHRMLRGPGAKSPPCSNAVHQRWRERLIIPPEKGAHTP